MREGDSVPQATLDQISAVVRAVSSGAGDSAEVRRVSRLPQRQASYSLSAAKTLKLVRVVDGVLALSRLGQLLAGTLPKSPEEAEAFRETISSNALMRLIAPGLLETSPPSLEETTQRIVDVTGAARGTASHRASMIHKWRTILNPLQRAFELGDEVPGPQTTAGQEPKLKKVRARVKGRGRSRALRSVRPNEEVLVVEGGALGPIPPCELRVRPLTVLVGPQGSGKSLLAQVLYFFRALPELIPVVVASMPRRNTGEPSAESLVKELLDGLRSPNRSFAGFADPSVSIRWTEEGQSERTIGFGAYKPSRRVRPDKHLSKHINTLITDYRKVSSQAIFIPTERLFYSQVRSPLASQFLSLPNTYTWFSEWMQRATEIFEGWKDATPDTPKGKWVSDRARQALRGEAYRWRDTWRWRYRRGNEDGTLDLDLASSGQRATWPIILLAETLFTMKRRGRLDPAFTIYVEEPEIHLHPEAQVAIVEILAYMVNSGFRVVVTTHSLPVLYAINNLVLAGSITSKRPADVPPRSVSLRKDQIAAYALGDGAPKDLVDSESGFISEVELGRVSEQLNSTMNVLTGLIYDTKGEG